MSAVSAMRKATTIMVISGRQILFITIIALTLILLAPIVRYAPQVQAAGLTFSVNTTVTLSGTGDNLTIASGSTASSIVVNSSNIVATVGDGDQLIVSVKNKSLQVPTNSGSVGISNAPCYSNVDSLGKLGVIGGTGGGSATIETTACTIQGPATSAFPITISTVTSPTSTMPTSTMPTTTAPVVTATTTTMMASSSEILPPLSANPTPTDIKNVLALALDQLTKISAAPNSLDAPRILEKIKSALESILQSGVVSGGTSQTLPSAVPPSGSYTNSLSLGSESKEVEALQSFLRRQADVYPEGLVTGYFGPLTREAVGKFQLKYGILTNKNDSGYGYVGPRTREKINSLLGL